MAILMAKNLKKKFKDFVAVDDLSIELGEGEILGILGPNGAGKTTTIQMLLGTLTPSGGTISYFGKNLKDHRTEIMEKVSFSSTYTNLPWYLTVRENLMWVSYMYDIKDRKSRISKIIELFNMGDIANLEMTELSSGQLTRVNMAKSFINFPKVLLLDEPTASLDVEVAKYIRELILKERNEFKASVIITSHNMIEVEELCDRVIVINNGKIVANDTPNALVRNIKLSHVELLINKGHENVIEYCERERITYKMQGKTISIDVPNDKISYFLQHLTRSGTSYSEISIEKPSLEDYFLQVMEVQHANS